MCLYICDHALGIERPLSRHMSTFPCLECKPRVEPGEDLEWTRQVHFQNPPGIVNGLEIEAATMPMTRVVNQSQDWVAAMNHRYLKDQIKDAAGFGKKSDIHGFNPITAYAYGTEIGHGPEGRY